MRPLKPMARFLYSSFCKFCSARAGPTASEYARAMPRGRSLMLLKVIEPLLMPEQEEAALVRRRGLGIQQIAVDRPSVHARCCASESAAASISQGASEWMLAVHEQIRVRLHDPVHGWINRKNVLRDAAGTTTWYCCSDRIWMGLELFVQSAASNVDDSWRTQFDDGDDQESTRLLRSPA